MGASMTPRERLLATIAGKIPDCVPAAPDFSNMIPARLTGKPFWDLYLYNDPPLWEAYIACAKHFNIDSLMDGYRPLKFPEELAAEPPWERFIVMRDEWRIVTQNSYVDSGKRVWQPGVEVFYVADPPTWGLDPAKIGLPPVPERFEPVEGAKPADCSPEGFKRAKQLMGDQGLVGAGLAGSCALYNEESIYNYYDHPETPRAVGPGARRGGRAAIQAHHDDGREARFPLRRRLRDAHLPDAADLPAARPAGRQARRSSWPARPASRRISTRAARRKSLSRSWPRRRPSP